MLNSFGHLAPDGSRFQPHRLLVEWLLDAGQRALDPGRRLTAAYLPSCLRSPGTAGVGVLGSTDALGSNPWMVKSRTRYGVVAA